MKPIYDQYNRLHDYVRISVTDRCPLRCVYCMPEGGLPFFPDDRVLSQDDIVQMVKNFVDMGITKVRFTGGEPLVRSDFVDIVQRVSNIDGVTDISATTNGLLLARKGKALKDAGLQRVNISLDTFDADKYKKITRGGRIQDVLDGIAAAGDLGLFVKLNVVVMKNQNDNEIIDFLNYTRDHNVNIRFIEFMPIGNQHDEWEQSYYNLDRVFDICKKNGIEYEHINLRGNGPSENYQIKGAKGSFGVIHPVSNKFCENCSRLRITADGYVKACLYWDEELYVRDAIYDPKKFRAIIQKALDNKPLNHEMALNNTDNIINKAPTWRHMSQIGG